MNDDGIAYEKKTLVIYVVSTSAIALAAWVLSHWYNGKIAHLIMLGGLGVWLIATFFLVLLQFYTHIKSATRQPDKPDFFRAKGSLFIFDFPNIFVLSTSTICGIAWVISHWYKGTTALLIVLVGLGVWLIGAFYLGIHNRIKYGAVFPDKLKNGQS